MTDTIRIIIAGPRGRMGREAVLLVQNTPGFKLAAVLDRKNDGGRLSDTKEFEGIDVPVYTDMDDCFTQAEADVLIDLTAPEAGKKHAEKAISYGIRPVVGTTGFTEDDIKRLTASAEEKGIGCIIAPNFAVGAVLMMKFSQMAAKYFSDVEIIEMHHDRKLDAPSGTAVKTAEMIKDVREGKAQGHPDEKETMKGARGAEMEGMHIHSVRLPGLIAHQQVMFGADGQMLTIRHDSFNRSSFMSGVKLAVETVMGIDTLVYGLENIME